MPDVSFFTQGGLVPSAIITSVRGTWRAPSGLRSRASEYDRISFCGLRNAANAISPTIRVSLRNFDSESFPQPSKLSVSTASLKDSDVTQRRRGILWGVECYCQTLSFSVTSIREWRMERICISSSTLSYTIR